MSLEQAPSLHLPSPEPLVWDLCPLQALCHGTAQYPYRSPTILGQAGESRLYLVLFWARKMALYPESQWVCGLLMDWDNP